MKKDTPFSSIKVFFTVINKYNMGIFIVTVAAGLMLMILTLTSIVDSMYDTSSSTNTSTFDQTTIRELSNLKSSDKNKPSVLNTNIRINPFSE